MGLLGDFLEAVYGPADRFRTVRAVMHHWKDPGIAQRADAELRPTGRQTESGILVPGRRSVTDSCVWVEPPGRVRVEQSRQSEGRVESSLTVANASRWWVRDHQGHVEVGDSGSNCVQGPALPEIVPLFSSAALRDYLREIVLEPVGPVRTAGRDCIHVRAAPRLGRLCPYWLPQSADRFDLHADPEHGVLLFVASSFRGEVFEVQEVREVVFNEPLDPELFTYEPSRSEQVQPAQPVAEFLSLPAAVTRMKFTVLVPSWVPDSYDNHWQVIYHPPRVNNRRSYICILYLGVGNTLLNQSNTEADLANYEWEVAERHGRRMEISDPGPGAGYRLIKLEHLGTYVDIRSDLDRDQLLELAASLTPFRG